MKGWCVQVYDTVALRVVVSDGEGPGAPDPIMTCYRLPPVAYRLWRRVLAEYDDYITRPKGSGYKSIHLAVIGPNGVPLEVQVCRPPYPLTCPRPSCTAASVLVFVALLCYAPCPCQSVCAFSVCLWCGTWSVPRHRGACLSVPLRRPLWSRARLLAAVWSTS